MNNELRNQKDEEILNTLSCQIFDMVSKDSAALKAGMVCEESEEIFKSTCKKVKGSTVYQDLGKEKLEKLCYVAALIVLKSGLFYVIEKACKRGFDIEDL